MPLPVDHGASARRVCRTGVGLLLILPVGCMQVAKELAHEERAARSIWLEANAARATTPAQALPLTWPEAVARLETHNPKLRAAALERLRAQESYSQVPRSLIPTVNVLAGYNRSLRHGGTTGFDPFTFAINGFFDIPGILNYRARYAAALLGRLRTELAADLIRREQTVELYRTFLAAGMTQLGQSRLAHRRELADHAGQRDRSALVAETSRLEREEAEWRGRLGELLGAPGTPWQPDPATLPTLAYGVDEPWPEPAALAQLPLRLAALDLVALRARRLGLELQGWPELNVYVTSPAFYQRSSGRESFWSTQDIFAGANVYWAPDTRGHRASERRILDAELAAGRAALVHEASRLADRLQTAIEQLRRLDAELAMLDAQTTALGSRPGQSRLLARVAAQRAELVAGRHEGELVLWFFDDRRWTSPPLSP